PTCSHPSGTTRLSPPSTVTRSSGPGDGLDASLTATRGSPHPARIRAASRTTGPRKKRCIPPVKQPGEPVPPSSTGPVRGRPPSCARSPRAGTRERRRGRLDPQHVAQDGEVVGALEREVAERVPRQTRRL